MKATPVRIVEISRWSVTEPASNATPAGQQVDAVDVIYKFVFLPEDLRGAALRTPPFFQAFF